MVIVQLNFSVCLLVLWEVVIIGLPVRAVHLKVLILTTLPLMNLPLRGALLVPIMNDHQEFYNNDPVQRSLLMFCKEYAEMINVLIVVPQNQIGHP